MNKYEQEDKHYDALERTGFWGHRAAGCIFWSRESNRFLLAHRSRYVQEPGTWGTWGGAIDDGETPEKAVHREAQEEAGYHGKLHLVALWVFRSKDFEYHNYLAEVDHEFDPKLDWENQGYRWVSYEDLPTMKLHPGMATLLKHINLPAIVEKLNAPRR